MKISSLLEMRCYICHFSSKYRDKIALKRKINIFYNIYLIPIIRTYSTIRKHPHNNTVINSTFLIEYITGWTKWYRREIIPKRTIICVSSYQINKDPTIVLNVFSRNRPRTITTYNVSSDTSTMHTHSHTYIAHARVHFREIRPEEAMRIIALDLELDLRCVKSLYICI